MSCTYPKKIESYETGKVVFQIQPAFSQLRELITRVHGEIPIDLEIANGKRYLFISYDQSYLTHGLHKYPAKFFPELPRWLIRKYSEEKEWVLDPFTGSATVNVECLLQKRHSVGIDIDPFSNFLARVKVTPLDTGKLEDAYFYIKKGIDNYKNNMPSEEQIPKFPYRDNWFNKYILQELAYIKQLILSTEEKRLLDFKKAKDRSIRNFFLICFSSIIRAVSNADDNCTRTVIRKKLNKVVSEEEALQKFEKAIDTQVPRMIEFSTACPQKITCKIPDNQDARDIKYPKGFFKLAITSPPYVNAVDYPRTHQLEMYWLGIAKGSLAPIKRMHVGTETVYSSECEQLHGMGIDIIDSVLEKIYQKDKRRSYILYKFLIDMQENLVSVKKVLKPGGKYVVVIGNNQMRGYVVESWKYLMEIADRVGYRIKECFGSEIINHFIKVPREERINTDWVIVLEKP